MFRVGFLLFGLFLILTPLTSAYPRTGRQDSRSPVDWMTGYTLVLVDADSNAELAEASDFIISQGGTVAIVLPPHSILGWITPEVGARIIGRHGIRSIHRTPVDSVPAKFRDRDTQLSVRVFNDIASGRRARQVLNEVKTQSAGDIDHPPMVDCALPRPPLDHGDFIRNLRSMGAQKSLDKLASITPQFFDNSNIMDGSVVVAIFLLESTGAIDTNYYSWNQADQDTAIAQAVDGLNWWVDQARAFNLGRPLRFTLLPYYANNPVCQLPYEPILHTGADAPMWVDRVMASLGSSSGDVFVRVASFNRQIRDEHHADWGFSIFVGYNPYPSPSAFQDGRASWAYLGGPYVMTLWRTFGWNIGRVISHETGHIFYACDEYDQPGYQTCSCSCAPEIRPLAMNGNCQVSTCNPTGSTQCMMRINEFGLCPWTVAQIGWIDAIRQAKPIPTAPASLVATASSATQVNLLWQDTSSSEDGFQIERRGGSSADFGLIGTIGPNSTGYADNAVLANTAYVYRVRAFNTTGNSPYTSDAAVITPSVTPLLSIALSSIPDATVGVPYSRSMIASGGTEPYAWVIDSGALPPGTSMSQTGDISGTPTVAGTSTFVVRVTDASSNTATRAFSWVVRPSAALTITTRDLPKGSVATIYSQSLGASGGQTPYTWAIQSGGLPDGLTLNQSSGVIAGTPERAGTSSFVLRLTDASNASVTAQLSIVINPVTTQLTIDTASLPDGVIGQDYSETLKALGGTSPYRWAVRQGSLPAGLEITEAGVIRGIPTAPGEVQFQVEVLDQSGQSASKQLSIDVDPAPQLTVLSTSPLTPGAIGVPYRVELRATSGSPPYTWSKKKKKKFGVLPAGIVLSPEGILSGVPTEQGTFNFTVRVNDRDDRLASKPFTMEVGPPPPPLEVRTQVLPPALQGVQYNARLEAGGGVAPYGWSIDVGVLPGGLTMTDGLISGRPTAQGSFPFTVRVRDSVGTSSTKTLFIIVSPPPLPLVIQTVQLPETPAERPYTQVLSATGGVTPYTWSLASGSIGQGLNLSASGLISGTPHDAGTLVFVVQVTDAAQQTAIRTLAIVVKPADRLAPFGNLETPDFRATLTGTVTGTGWALDNLRVATVEVLIDGTKVGDAIYGLARPDIAVVWGQFPNGSNSGFSFALDTTKLTNGDHTLAVRVTDGAANVTILGARLVQVQNRLLAIITTDIPRGRKGEPYSFQLMAANGRPPYTWSLLSGTLPQGLSLNASGIISGTPVVFGAFPFSIRVVDSINAPAIASVTMNILPDVEPLRVVSTGDQTPGLTGKDYVHQLLYAGGRSPILWSVASGSLPPGLTLNTVSGLISGRPRQDGTFTFTVRVVDSEQTQVFSDPLRIVITLGPLGVVDFGNLPSARTGVDYSFALLGTGGSPPYVWATFGTLPPGLTLNPTTGVISGRPTLVGSNAFSIRITDSTSATALSDTLRIVVDAGPLSIVSVGALAAGNVNVDYTYQLQLNGGKQPYTWSVSPGSLLPPGLTLNASTGAISGKPTAAGTFNFTVQVIDSQPASATSGTLTIVVSP
ncbi:MAG TPA: putative Ig domain-containing protein [Blastocatellia bacterium]|nr:putative Ig domain-containing protein [Blastocatellia bacterium]